MHKSKNSDVRFHWIGDQTLLSCYTIPFFFWIPKRRMKQTKTGNELWLYRPESATERVWTILTRDEGTSRILQSFTLVVRKRWVRASTVGPRVLTNDSIRRNYCYFTTRKLLIQVLANYGRLYLQAASLGYPETSFCILQPSNGAYHLENAYFILARVQTS